MIELAWMKTTWPLLLGLSLSFVLELLLQPRPIPPWQRPYKALMIHFGIWLLLCSPLMLLLHRPWSASVALMVMQLFIILISNAKYHSLREPFIYQDFSYFVDALRYPRLYLPFLRVWSGLAFILGVGVSVTTSLLLEQPVEMPLAAVISLQVLV
jgi:hypothetical protein